MSRYWAPFTFCAKHPSCARVLSPGVVALPAGVLLFRGTSRERPGQGPPPRDRPSYFANAIRALSYGNFSDQLCVVRRLTQGVRLLNFSDREGMKAWWLQVERAIPRAQKAEIQRLFQVFTGFGRKSLGRKE